MPLSQVEMDVECLNNYFLKKPLLSGVGKFAVPRTNNVPELSESEIYDADMSRGGLAPQILVGFFLRDPQKTIFLVKKRAIGGSKQ
jgi:hypothetical protein